MLSQGQLHDIKQSVFDKIFEIKHTPHTYHEQKEICNEISKKLTNLFLMAQMNGRITEVLLDFSIDPIKWLIPWESKTYLFPDLSECNCKNTNNFNRFQNDRRKTIESNMFDFINTRFPTPKKSEIHYLSFGCGKLLQDFIFIVKLMLRKYSSIHVHLVDTHLDSQSLKQFELLFSLAKELGIQIYINTYFSIDEYINQAQTKPDLISIIDFDDFLDAFDDIVTAHQFLHPQGRMFLSYKKNDLIFSADQCLKSNLESDSIVPSITISNKKRINISCLYKNNWMYNLCSIIIPIIKNHQQTEAVELNVTKPLNVGFFGQALDKPNLHITEENLGYYISLFLPTIKNIQINFNTQLNQRNADLMIYFDDQPTSWYHLKKTLKDLKENHPNSTMFFKVVFGDSNCSWIYNQLTDSVCFLDPLNDELNSKISDLYTRLKSRKGVSSGFFYHNETQGTPFVEEILSDSDSCKYSPTQTHG